MLSITLIAAAGLSLAQPEAPVAAPQEPQLQRIAVSDDGQDLILTPSGERFRIWGVNYDHDGPGRLLEDYWIDEWDTVVEDFGEIRDLGANVVRIHLQFGRFMTAPETPDEQSLARLGDLVELAESTSLYLDITGLGCYHKADVPPWYDALPEQQRWEAQARFWSAVAETCAGSPAVFCYDLMNEPILPGENGDVQTDWLAGDFAGKHFVQRISLDLRGRTRIETARAWVEQMVEAIREHDAETLITVGVIPWAQVFPGAKPIFYAPEVAPLLDVVSVHFYPKSGELDRAINALAVYDIGKPLVVEEFFPLACSFEEMFEFMERVESQVDGWVSFYWGTTAEELRAKEQPTISEAILAQWFDEFRKRAEEMTR